MNGDIKDFTELCHQIGLYCRQQIEQRSSSNQSSLPASDVDKEVARWTLLDKIVSFKFIQIKEIPFRLRFLNVYIMKEVQIRSLADDTIIII